MDLVQSSVFNAGYFFLRVFVQYGTFLFPLEEQQIEKIVAHLLETLGALIFIHKDCYISREKPRLLPSQSKQLLKSVALHDPLTFVAHFNLDCDSKDFGPRAELKSVRKLPEIRHELNVDSIFSVPPVALEGDLFSCLCDEVYAFLTAYRLTLKSLLLKHNTIPRSLTAYHFRYADQLIRILYPPVCENEAKLREEIHMGLGLPHKPILRRGLALFPSRSFRRLLGPNKENLVSPHLLLPSATSNANICCKVIRGRYTYKHYMQDGVDDKNWGCAYRSLQTLASWVLWQGIVTPLQPLPLHRDIQKTLVRIGDKPDNFIDSRQWIGSLEVSLCLSELYGVQCRILPVAQGREFASTAATVLAEHFSSDGGPVMVGGGELAHTIVGVQFPIDSSATGASRTRFLVLDPHYTGEPACVETILNKGWVGWKNEGFWRADVPYNLCLLPQPLDTNAV